MIENSHKQETWCSLEGLTEKDGTWFANLLVRWYELQTIEQAEEGECVGYKYTAHRIVYALPENAPTSVDELPLFLEGIKDVLIAAAQDRMSQSEGLHGGN